MMPHASNVSDRDTTSTAALSGVAHAGMFVFGMVMALLGTVLPLLSQQVSLGLADVGTLFLVMNGAMLATGLVLGLAIDRFGIKAPVLIGAALVAGGVFVMLLASSVRDLFLAVALLGFGGGALNGSTNTLVADLHQDPRQKTAALNALGVYFGIGALVLPFSLGALIAQAGLSGVLLGAAALCIGVGVMAATVRFPPAKQAHHPSTTPTSGTIASIRQLCREPLILALAALLFFQSGNEFVLGGYVTTFLTRDLAVSIDRASYVLAVYWAALMAARVVLSRAALHLNEHAVIFGGAAVSIVGALLIGAARTLPVAVAGIVLTGTALAGIFPTVLSLAGAAFRDRSGTVFGILFTVALTGGMLMPWLAGHLAADAGLRVVFGLVAANFAIIALLDTRIRVLR